MNIINQSTELLILLVTHLECQEASPARGDAIPPEFLKRLQSMSADQLRQAVCTLSKHFVTAMAASHEQMILIGITDFKMDPHAAERMNLPTLAGSLLGSMLPAIDESKVCTSCAFRQSTPANQSSPTVEDAMFCLDDPFVSFMCHEDLDASGEPTKVCRGFAQARKIMNLGVNHVEHLEGDSKPDQTY